MQHDGCVQVTVCDDGRGIPEDVLSKFRGISLAGMKERLAEFGGQIDVLSSSAGSVVQAVIPTRANGSAQESLRFYDPRLMEAGRAEGKSSRTPKWGREPIDQ